MNSRERVLAALAHREPDRVPIDLGGSLVTGIGAVAYSHLKRCMGVEGDPPRVADIILQLAEVEEPVRRRFGVDVIGLPALEPVPGVRNLHWKPWTLPDGSPALISADFEPHVTERGDLLIRAPDGTVTQRMPIGTYHFLPVNPPLVDANLEDLAHFEGHRISDEELEFLHRAARRLHEETDYAIFGWFGGSLIEAGQFARGWDRFLVDLKQAPEFAAALVERLAAVALADLARYLEAVGDFVHVVGFGDDLGIQTGLQFNPDLYRRFFKPYHRQIYGLVHARSQARVFLHSCGSVYDLIPDLIEVGVDILNPVQTSAARMEPTQLKQEFGGRLTFWGGGCCPHRVLPWATPAGVQADVQRVLKTFAPGGGYIFAPIHDIQADVPPENIVAMYDAALRYGRYPM
jgi:uroporphyrinogen decarboxylase